MSEMSVKYTGDEIEAKIPYKLIVECFEKRYDSIRKRRKYVQDFTLEDRKLIRKFYHLFFNWYLVKGIPNKGHFFTVSEIGLIDRAAHFFGTC